MISQNNKEELSICRDGTLTIHVSFCMWASPYINHFISADTIVPEQYNPQNLNRYSYVLNNPLKYTDPTGHMQSCEDGDVCRSPKTTSSPTTSNRNRHRRPLHEDDPEDKTGNKDGKPLLAPESSSPTQNGSSSGGDEDVGYEIRYDVGVVLLHYYGQSNVFNMSGVGTDSLAYQALMDFERNADARVDASNNIKSAATDLFVSTGETILGGGLTALGVITSGGGATTPLGVAEIGIGLGLAAHGGASVYSAAMSWGQAAGALGNANANLSSSWDTLSNLP